MTEKSSPALWNSPMCKLSRIFACNRTLNELFCLSPALAAIPESMKTIQMINPWLNNIVCFFRSKIYINKISDCFTCVKNAAQELIFLWYICCSTLCENLFISWDVLSINHFSSTPFLSSVPVVLFHFLFLFSFQDNNSSWEHFQSGEWWWIQSVKCLVC